jgi:hypothetical protein
MDLDKMEISPWSRDAISAALSASRFNEKEVHNILLAKFKKFEENQ